MKQKEASAASRNFLFKVNFLPILIAFLLVIIYFVILYANNLDQLRLKISSVIRNLDPEQVQWNSRTFLAYRTEPNYCMGSIEPNSVLLHLNDFTWCIWCIWMIFMSSVQSNRTRKSIEILKNSIRFDRTKSN